MRHRSLGRSELQVPVVVFGAWAIGGWYWGGSDDDQAVRAIHAAIDHGMNAIDTAPVYGFGRSEEVVGRAIRDRRERVIVMTKIGLRWDKARGEPYFETVDQDGVKRSVFRHAGAASIQEEVEASLARMQIAHIDLIQVHWPDLATPVAETMGALLELRAQGKVRAIGVSNYTVAMMQEARAALGPVPLASVQPKYNLLAREAEKELLPYCAAENIGAIVYSPLEQGLLTGRVTASRTFAVNDGRQKRATFTPENRALVNACLDRVVRPIAEKHSATIGQIVIAWTVAQRGVTSAIVGARTSEQAIENARAGAIELIPGERADIRAAFAALHLSGALAPRSHSLWKALAKKILGR
ncbi:MAG: aldo/keto reductase [Planctomycetes bacterium]|nr:aldo/keto reductase [Planctomycetota bacterium]